MQKKWRDLPPLDLLRGFEAAARHLSFTKAAAELFLTQSAVSRQVQALEAALGVPLFQRRHRALLLTDHGQLLQQAVARVLRDLRHTVEQMTAGSTRLLTVTTMVTFAALWLVPRLPEFRRRHPQIDVHISANNELLDLERSRIDVAIRYVAPDRVPASAITLFGEEVLPVCAPALLKDRARPLRVAADLSRHVLLHLDDPPGMSPYLEWRSWLEAMGLPDLKAAGDLYFSHYDQLIHAAAEGQGLALGRLPLLSRQLRERRLVAPFEDGAFGARRPRSSRAYFVLTTPGAAERPEVRHFIEWLREESRQESGAAPAPRAPAPPPSGRSPDRGSSGRGRAARS
jgi:DNA-binding transcriptional LysR family regulator